MVFSIRAKNIKSLKAKLKREGKTFSSIKRDNRYKKDGRGYRYNVKGLRYRR